MVAGPACPPDAWLLKSITLDAGAAGLHERLVHRRNAHSFSCGAMFAVATFQIPPCKRGGTA